MTVDQYLLIILVVILVVIFHRRYVVVFIITIRSIAAAVLEFVFVVVLWLWHGRNWSFISSTTKKIKVRIDSPPITQTRTNPLGYQKHFVLWTSHIDHDIFIIDIIFTFIIISVDCWCCLVLLQQQQLLLLTFRLLLFILLVWVVVQRFVVVVVVVVGVTAAVNPNSLLLLLRLSLPSS